MTTNDKPRETAAILAARDELLARHRELEEARRAAEAAHAAHLRAADRYLVAANAFSALTPDGDRYLVEGDLLISRRGPGLAIEPRERSRRTHD